MAILRGALRFCLSRVVWDVAGRSVERPTLTGCSVFMWAHPASPKRVICRVYERVCDGPVIEGELLLEPMTSIWILVVVWRAQVTWCLVFDGRAGELQWLLKGLEEEIDRAQPRSLLLCGRARVSREWFSIWFMRSSGLCLAALVSRSEWAQTRSIL
jgi:hypothetical protein